MVQSCTALPWRETHEVPPERLGLRRRERQWAVLARLRPSHSPWPVNTNAVFVFFIILLSKYCDLLKFCQFTIIDSKFPLSNFDNQKWEAPAGWWDGKKCDLQLRVIISGGERRECHFSSWCSNIDPRAHQVGGGTGWVSIQLAV